MYNEKFDLRTIDTKAENYRVSVLTGEIDFEKYGCKSDKLSFKHSIRNDMFKVAMGERKMLMGHCFVSTEDVTIPVIKLKPNARSEFDVADDFATRTVKAGEDIILNNIETAVFLSSPEYNCVASGNNLTFNVGVDKYEQGKPVPKFTLYENGKYVDGKDYNEKYTKFFAEKVDDKYKVLPEYEDTFGAYARCRHLRFFHVEGFDTGELEHMTRNMAIADIFKTAFIK